MAGSIKSLIIVSDCNEVLIGLLSLVLQEPPGVLSFFPSHHPQLSGQYINLQHRFRMLRTTIKMNEARGRPLNP